jgi:hypothetical protein
MKRVIFVLGILLSVKSISQLPKFVYKLNTTEFNLTIPGAGLENNGQGIGGALESSSMSTLFKSNGALHIIGTPAYSYKPLPALHFINSDGTWKIENYYPQVTMGNARNIDFVDSSTVVFADHGLEQGNPWPYGDLWVAKNNKDTLSWTKASKYKSFYHCVAQGDINGDGLYDVIGLNMGTYSDWGYNLHAYTQNKDGTFSEDRNILAQSNFINRGSGGSVLIYDLDGDKIPEIIRGSYAPLNNEARYIFDVMGYDPILHQYIKKYEPKDLSFFKDLSQGSTSMKAADFDKDGNIDLAIASEGYPNNRIIIYNGQKDGSFKPGQIISYGDTSGAYPNTGNTFREFMIDDIDNDGWIDIVVHPGGYGEKFRIDPGPNNPNHYNNGMRGSGVYLNYPIWKNTNGLFVNLEDKVPLFNIFPGNLRAFKVGNNLKYFGFQANLSAGVNVFMLHDITLTFCNYLKKPNFNTSKFSFCSGDSLKLTISNVNKGDTLKWFYGTKSDLSNVTNKIFTDSAKVFVTRTDSLGCVISSDTVSLIKYITPTAPILSRDTANNLVANINGITWYKDGTAITDTTQKIKPTTGGSYTAKTTQNGCVSQLSTSYYYLVTDIINLNANEYIKLAPNPFSNQLNLDFEVKGYQRLNMEVYDIATGTKVASKQNLNPGMPIYLGQLSAGTYVIKVTSNDNRIKQQFKVLKM